MRGTLKAPRVENSGQPGTLLRPGSLNEKDVIQ